MKIIALDLDGTLLRSDKTVSPHSVEMLKQCKNSGMRIVVATARAPRSVAALLPSELQQETWICYNGAEIYQAGKRIYENPIPSDIAKQAVKRVESVFPGCPASVEINGSMFANQKLPYPWHYEIGKLQKVITGGVAKILFSIEEPSAADILNQQLPRECRLIVTDGGTLGQIMSSSASKLTALQHLIDQWHLPLSEVIAFGDDFNDLEMIEASGIGVAMGNAVTELKKKANRMAKTNDEDGVAVMLGSLLTDIGGKREEDSIHL